MGYRLAAYDELPRTGVPELFRTKEEFDAYIAAQVKAGIIADSSYIWWAIRPSLAHPTLELRAPDCCTLIEDAIAISALYRTLVRHLYYNPWRKHGMTAVSRALVAAGTGVCTTRPRARASTTPSARKANSVSAWTRSRARPSGAAASGPIRPSMSAPTSAAAASAAS